MVLNPGCTLESPGELFVVPLAKPLNESIKSESLEVGLVIDTVSKPLGYF